MAIIDTGIVFDYLKGIPSAVTTLAAYPSSSISVLTRYALLREARKLPVLVSQETERFLNTFRSRIIDDNVAAIAGELQHRFLGLTNKNALILATAISNKEMLITSNASLAKMSQFVIIAY